MAQSPTRRGRGKWRRMSPAPMPDIDPADEKRARAERLFLSATKLHEQGHLDRALARYDAVIVTAPEHVGALNLSGVILAERGEHVEAVRRFSLARKYARADEPNLANIHNNLALSLASMGDTSGAINALEAALSCDPNHTPALVNLAQHVWRRGDIDWAAGLLRRAVQSCPDCPEYHTLLGAVLHDQNRLVAARHEFERAISLGDETGQAFAGLGATLRLLGESEEAEQALRSALDLHPEWGGVRSTYALVIAQRQRHVEALAESQCALEQEPDHEQVGMNHALLLLAAGRMEAGWDALETARGRGPVDFRGARVHLTREEGLGDELLYSTVLPDLIADATQVSLDCDPRLAGLLARTYPEIAVNQVAEGGYDIVTGMGALPAHYRRTRRSFTGTHRRLAADPALVAQMREWRNRHVGRPVVGISWRSQLATAERRLEYPRLDEFGRIFSLQGIDWVNLQYDDCEQELRDAEARFGITIDRADGVDLRNDQERVAALMSTLDAVIAPRNAVAMLAGALGIPCVMVGNRFDWFDFGVDIEDEGSPWFPSFRPVMRVPDETWDPVLFRAAGRLSTALKGKMEEVRG